MNKLKKFLVAFLLCSVFFVVSNVSAATIDRWGVDLTRPDTAYFYNCQNNTCTSLTTDTISILYIVGTTYNEGMETYSYNYMSTYYTPQNWTWENTTESILVAYRFQNGIVENGYYSLTNYVCTNISTSPNFFGLGGGYTANRIADIQTLTYPIDIEYNEVFSISSEPFNFYESGGLSNPFVKCSAYNVVFKPTKTLSNTFFGFRFKSTGSNAKYYFLGYSMEFLGNTTDNSAITSQLEKLESSVKTNSNQLQSIQDLQEEVESNTAETNKKLDETNDKLNDVNDSVNDVNDSITNSDITGSQGTANGFFNNFNTEDNGGISAIVTAPLKAINSMVEGTCQPLTATWRGKTISLPCGTEFWNKMAPIRTFLNVLEGGIICYGILIDLYKMINRMKDPEDDRVEVMKL